ncbi:MAG: metalloregulator ArsR/SmtB family transcription factor [Candidatus Hodarchaeales archaeon]|jgi:DNA-binding transcriptional ArsR family regulator/uncharacterized protein YndB with AHSA1/START domain
MNDQTLVWKALADPTRRQILDILRNKPKKAGELSETFPITREAIAKHMRILKKANLVLNKKKGRENWYYLNVIPLEEIYDRWMRPYEIIWSSSLIKLKKQIEQSENTMNMNFIDIEQKIYIEAAREKVFKSLTTNISNWWGRPFIINEQTTEIILEPEIGGRFFETWGNEQGYKWGEVTYIKNNEILEITGPFGKRDALFGKVCFTLEDHKKGTNILLSHQMFGQVDEETKKGYSRGWEDLIGRRLKKYVEENEKLGLGHEPPMEE